MNQVHDIDYGDALDRLGEATEAFQRVILVVRGENAAGRVIVPDPWNTEIWKRLCELSAATREAEVAYWRTHSHKETTHADGERATSPN